MYDRGAVLPSRRRSSGPGREVPEVEPGDVGAEIGHVRLRQPVACVVALDEQVCGRRYLRCVCEDMVLDASKRLEEISLRVLEALVIRSVEQNIRLVPDAEPAVARPPALRVGRDEANQIVGDLNAIDGPPAAPMCHRVSPQGRRSKLGIPSGIW